VRARRGREVTLDGAGDSRPDLTGTQPAAPAAGGPAAPRSARRHREVIPHASGITHHAPGDQTPSQSGSGVTTSFLPGGTRQATVISPIPRAKAWSQLAMLRASRQALRLVTPLLKIGSLELWASSRSCERPFLLRGPRKGQTRASPSERRLDNEDRTPGCDGALHRSSGGRASCPDRRCGGRLCR